MNPTANPPVDMKMLEETRRHINRLIEEVGRLAESELPPSEFYGELLKRVLAAMAAPAGAVWTRTSQGNLQLQFHINMREVGLDRSEQAKQTHDELLRRAVLNPQPLHLLPHSGMGPGEEGKIAAGNPTEKGQKTVASHLKPEEPFLACTRLLEHWRFRSRFCPKRSTAAPEIRGPTIFPAAVSVRRLKGSSRASRRGTG